MKKLLFYSLIFICSVSLSACLSIERNIKFDASGKGNEKMTVVLGKEFMTTLNELSQLDESGKTDVYDDKKFINEISSSLGEIPGIKINDVKSTMGADSSNTLNIDYDFDNIHTVAQALGDSKTAGDSSLTYYTEGNSVYFDYIVNMNSGSVAEDTTNASMKQAYNELFANDKMKISVEFPYEVVSSNGIVNGNKVTWEIPVNDIMKKDPVKISAVLKK